MPISDKLLLLYFTEYQKILPVMLFWIVLLLRPYNSWTSRTNPGVEEHDYNIIKEVHIISKRAADLCKCYERCTFELGKDLKDGNQNSVPLL